MNCGDTLKLKIDFNSCGEDYVTFNCIGVWTPMNNVSS